MNSKARPIRSALYVPGNKEDWIRKAPQYGCLLYTSPSPRD